MCIKLFKGRDYMRIYDTQYYKVVRLLLDQQNSKLHNHVLIWLSYQTHRSLLRTHLITSNKVRNKITLEQHFFKLLLREKIKRWNINNPLHHLDHPHQPHLPILQIMDLHLHLFVSQSAINILLKLKSVFQPWYLVSKVYCSNLSRLGLI